VSFTELAIRPLWVPLFLSMMIGLGWRVRDWKLEQSFLLYPLALLATSSAVALQYFAPPCFSIAADFNWLGGAYNVFTGYFLGGHPDEVKLWAIGTWLFNREEPGAYYWNQGWLLSQFLILAITVQRIAREERRLIASGSVAPTTGVRRVSALLR